MHIVHQPLPHPYVLPGTDPGCGFRASCGRYRVLAACGSSAAGAMLRAFCRDGAGCRNCLRHRQFKRLAESFCLDGGGPDIRPA